MAKEIEKKYLVKNELLPKLTDGEIYIQGYLSLNPLIRFRVKGNSVTIAIKKVEKDGVCRDEWEFKKEMINEEIEKLISLAIKKPIKKIRYKIKKGEFIWEVDIYQDENLGLITADIELPDVNTIFNFPEWIDKSMEITNDPNYFNVNLGDNPYCNWSKR